MAYALFAALMYAAVVLKDRIVDAMVPSPPRDGAPPTGRRMVSRLPVIAR